MTARVFILLSLIMVFVQCKEEKNVQKLLGTWHFNTVYRNQKETKTLEGGYFDFISDSTMQSNVLHTTEPITYKYDGENIVLYADETYEFNISKHTNDTLIVTGYMNTFEMKFIMTSLIAADSTIFHQGKPQEIEN